MRFSAEGRTWMAFCLDLSVSGIGAWSAESVEPGAYLSATLKHNDEGFEIEAQVIRCEDTRPARLGLRITRVHPKLFQLLEAA